MKTPPTTFHHLVQTTDRGELISSTQRWMLSSACMHQHASSFAFDWHLLSNICCIKSYNYARRSFFLHFISSFSLKVEKSIRKKSFNERFAFWERSYEHFDTIYAQILNNFLCFIWTFEVFKSFSETIELFSRRWSLQCIVPSGWLLFKCTCWQRSKYVWPLGRTSCSSTFAT